jgi:hypothetical protein
VRNTNQVEREGQVSETTPGSIWKVKVVIPGGGEKTYWILTTSAERAMGGVRGAVADDVDVDVETIEFLLVQRMTMTGTIIIDPDLLEAGGYVLQDEAMPAEADPFG